MIARRRDTGPLNLRRQERPWAFAWGRPGLNRRCVLRSALVRYEDLDLPNVDTVMMLRPTESQIIWLQQFGRGLRFQENKRLKVIDYIGNHRSFLIKPRALFQLGPGDREVAYALDRLEAGTMELPPGCSVTYELEVKDILRSLIRIPQRGEALQAYYQDFLERNGVRPTAVEAFNDGYDPKALRKTYGSWFGFVDAMDGLSAEERESFQALRSFLVSLARSSARNSASGLQA